MRADVFQLFECPPCGPDAQVILPGSAKTPICECSRAMKFIANGSLEFLERQTNGRLPPVFLDKDEIRLADGDTLTKYLDLTKKMIGRINSHGRCERDPTLESLETNRNALEHLIKKRDK